MFQLSRLKNMSFVNSYLSLGLTHDVILPFSNNCDIELTSLENLGKCIAVPSIFIYLLNRKN